MMNFRESLSGLSACVRIVRTVQREPLQGASTLFLHRSQLRIADFVSQREDELFLFTLVSRSDFGTTPLVHLVHFFLDFIFH